MAQVYTTLSTGSTLTTLYFMGGAYEKTVENNSLRKYYAIAGMTVAMNDGNGLKYLLTDHLGSVVAVTNANGELVSQQRYLPFGEPRTIPNSPITQTDFAYTGQRKLDDGMGGIMDYKARFYSPALGRFLQPDSIIPDPSNPQSLNRYSYVNNDPVATTDPSGHVPCSNKIIRDDQIVCTGGSSGSNGDNGGQGGGNNNSSSNVGNNNADAWDYITNCVESLGQCYMQGWKNAGGAWSIYWNPNASLPQRAGAGLYMAVWGLAHACLIICTGVVAAEYLAPGSITCLMMLKCAESVFWSGGEVAQSAAENFAQANNGVTLEMTLPGRALDLVGKVVPYQYLKPFWDLASGQFARGASGNVNVFLYPPAYNPAGTWATIEEIALQANPNVISIIKNIVP